MDFLRKLRNLETPSEFEIRRICQSAIKHFVREQNIVDVESPVNICGDIHGQFFDLLNIFKMHGTPETSKYVFLGDYVDRGHQSFETYLTLLCYKALYPKNIFLIRGNHETNDCGRNLGFRTELERKFPRSHECIYSIISDTFRFLNVGAIVDGRVFCVHGGISPNFQTIQQLQVINRFSRNVDKVIVDLMWSDPHYEKGFKRSPRGAGYLFGQDELTHFLAVNDLNYLVRAHQFMKNGYKIDFKSANCLTVWSAPHYMYFYDNVASVLKYDGQHTITKSDFYIFHDVHDEFNQYRTETKNIKPDEDCKYRQFHKFY
ncbi:hypothetical protein EDEG_03628 [Edhazardia aedis USNM 41457]|uniref:Serine/threonine-protein phosphatase n=1 Tax=Edhazardia aedis (strain USNM 41457) TaxID=1003232 RepID=J9DKI0_EDHAE|nr:hypothetical protein EDEG_03628 [Edhazardia aedis USNM 41457]|eukprot:EJW01897.1 hypothetical protein EDEG_03628 [Edhazardia aedis USNM 41457]